MSWIDNVTNKLKLEIPASRIDSNLNNFPILIHLSDECGINGFSASGFFETMMSDGNRKKIAVTTFSGSPCYVEIERWSQLDKEAWLWTKIPEISSSQNTILYLYYDPTTSGNTSYVGDIGSTPAQNVWDSNFVAVWHLNDVYDGTSGEVIDSTGSHNGQGGAGTASYCPTRVEGKTGFGQSFDGIDDYITIPDDAALTLSTTLTIDVVVKFDSPTSNNDGIVTRETNGYSFGKYSTGKLSISKSGVDELQSTATISDTEWYLFSAGRDGANDFHYINGELDSSAAKNSFNDVSSLYIGANAAAAGWELAGDISEVRLSDIKRPDAWIKATYYSTFDQLLYIADPTIETASWLGDWNKRIKLTIDKDRVDEDLYDFPVSITLASGTGITSSDVTDVFDELSVVASGTDPYTKLLLHFDNDASGNTNSFTINGHQKIESGGYFDQTFYFDGASDFIYTASNTNLSFGTSDFCMEFWAKVAVTQSVADPLIYCNWNSSWSANDWSLHCAHNVTGNKWSFWVNNYNSGSPMLTSTSTSNINTWTHVAVTRSGNDWRLFIDGIQEGSTVTSSVSLDGGGAQSFYISGPQGSQYYKGYLEELRVSIGAARWASNFTPPTEQYTTTSGIDSYTKLLIHPEGDVSTNQHDITFNGNVQMLYNGQFDGSYYFDGSGDYLTVPQHSDFNFGTGEFTIDGWLYALSIPSVNRFIAGGSDSDGAYNQWFLGKYYAGSQLNFGYQHGGGYTETGSDTITWNTNTWYHFACVRKGAYIFLFWDGQLIKTWNMGASVQINTGSYGLMVAGRYYNQNPYELFNGYLDEIRIRKGIAQWTSSFTRPTAPHTADSIVLTVSETNNKKIAVTGANGIAQQYVEIENWDVLNERATIWTKVPYISSSNDTEMYLYYDKNQLNNTVYVGDTGTNQARAVWNSNFLGVYHMAQDPTDGVLDSTSNMRNMTQAGDMAFGEDGDVGRAIRFDGVNDRLYTASLDYSSLQTAHTLEAKMKWWNNPDTNYERVAQLGPNSNGAIIFSRFSTTNYYQLGVWGDNLTTNITLDVGYWRNIVTRAENNVMDFVKDGVTDPTTNTVTFANLSSQPLTIAARNGGGSSEEGHIIVEEFRVSNVYRSDGWLLATHYSNNNDLITYGAPEDYTADITSYYYYGYITENELPVARKVYIYNRSTGALMGTTTSNASDGYYYLTTTISGEHFIVVLDDDAGETYNALIADRLTHKGVE